MKQQNGSRGSKTILWLYFSGQCSSSSTRTPLSLIVPWLRPFVLLTEVALRWVWRIGGLKLTRQNRSTWRRTCPSATFYTTNFTWTGPESNHASAVTNRLNHGRAKDTPAMWCKHHASLALLWRTVREPRHNLHALPTELNRLAEQPRRSFSVSTSLSHVLIPNGTRWGYSFYRTTGPSLRFTNPKKRISY